VRVVVGQPPPRRRDGRVALAGRLGLLPGQRPEALVDVGHRGVKAGEHGSLLTARVRQARHLPGQLAQPPADLHPVICLAAVDPGYLTRLRGELHECGTQAAVRGCHRSLPHG